MPRNFGRLRRQELLGSGAVDALVDVGAADGRWAAQARAHGFRGPIHSFEPRADAFAALAARAAADGRWTVANVALGDAAGSAELALDGESSSLHRRSGATATVEVARLDDLLPLDRLAAGYLKIDVEGAELAVLAGATATLERCAAVEVEVSFAPFYDGQPSALQVMSWIEAHGFRLVAFDARGSDRASGDLLDANVFFLRA